MIDEVAPPDVQREEARERRAPALRAFSRYDCGMDERTVGFDSGSNERGPRELGQDGRLGERGPNVKQPFRIAKEPGCVLFCVRADADRGMTIEVTDQKSKICCVLASISTHLLSTWFNLSTQA